MIAADEFGFALGKIEGHAVGFREDRDGEYQESNGGGEPEQEFADEGVVRIVAPER